MTDEIFFDELIKEKNKEDNQRYDANWKKLIENAKKKIFQVKKLSHTAKSEKSHENKVFVFKVGWFQSFGFHSEKKGLSFVLCLEILISEIHTVY